MTFKTFMKIMKKYRREYGPAADDTEIAIKIAGDDSEVHAIDDFPVMPNPTYNLTIIKVV